MLHAIELARRGWGRVSPNPMVGAVVLAPITGEIVGEGYHAEFGGRHAEPVAIDAAGDAARGATLVVTLEPCTHHGNQPPCVDAILAAGIKRVVIGALDPNPEAADGAIRLAEAGVEVETGVEARSVERVDPAFFHRYRNPDRPFVALKLATSLDFKIADRHGASRWISGSPAREWAHWLRAGFDAVAVGGRTARADDPALTVRGAVHPRRPPRRVIFDGAGALPMSLKMMETAREVPVTIVTRLDPDRTALAALVNQGADTLAVPSLHAALGRLREMGLHSLLVEGGGRLAGGLLAAGLVDRFYWVQSPVWLGDQGTPAVAGLPGGPLAGAVRWDVTERLALGEDTLLVLDRAGCLPG